MAPQFLRFSTMVVGSSCILTTLLASCVMPHPSRVGSVPVLAAASSSVENLDEEPLDATSSLLPKTLWGAIRWDAFYNDTNDPNQPCWWVAHALQPQRWHDRLPWFTYIDPATGNVTFNGNAPSIMNAEISYAVENGIDHWVFDVYPPSNLMSQSLYAYLNATSPLKGNLSFALLLQAGWMTSGGIDEWNAKIKIYVQHFSRPEYRLVLGNRPLLYLFNVNEEDWGGGASGGGWKVWHQALEMLANASVAAGRGRPYIVLQSFNPTIGAEKAASINSFGYDKTSSVAKDDGKNDDDVIQALSAYALPQFATNAGTPWPSFAQSTQAFWDDLAATGFDVVPPVPAGWDQRPRVETPPPWVPHPSAAYIEMPTPEQMGALVQAAINWTTLTNKGRRQNPARLHLLSAWNEYDEGHFIGPVLEQFGGDDRLKGIGAILKGR